MPTTPEPTGPPAPPADGASRRGLSHSEIVGPRKRRVNISGMVVHVRLGLALAVCGAATALAMLVLVLVAPVGWPDIVLLVAAAALSALGAWNGVWGVIRYGLFTEGRGAAQVAGELHLARFAYVAGIVSQFALMVTVVATVILVVRAIAG